MGYADIGQKGGGIHLRQFSRAFIFVRGDARAVLVTADIHSIDIGVRRQVGLIWSGFYKTETHSLDVTGNLINL